VWREGPSLKALACGDDAVASPEAVSARVSTFDGINDEIAHDGPHLRHQMAKVVSTRP
jgi:hypothetical protein